MLKHKLTLIICFFISFLIFNCVKADDLVLLNKKIYLDAGHGGIDPGATYNDIYEKNITLSIVRKLATTLEKNGATVYLTRNGDYDLSRPNASRRKKSDLDNRISLINNSDCDIYLSIHLNSETNTTWSGAQVFYDTININNKEFANTMQKKYAEELLSKRKIKKNTSLYMYKNIKKEGLLLEVGFLSNPNERYKLKQDEYQKKIANATTKGIIEYFKNY